MHFTKGQRGISFIGLMFVLVVLGGGSLLGLKLFPVYLESFKIHKAVEGVLSAPNVGQSTIHEIQKSLIKRFDIDSITAITHRNFKEHVVISSKNDVVSIAVNYEAVIPLLDNIYLLIIFDKYADN